MARAMTEELRGGLWLAVTGLGDLAGRAVWRIFREPGLWRVLFGGPPRDGKGFYQVTDISAGCVGCGVAGCDGGRGVLNDEEDWALWRAVACAMCPPGDGELKKAMAGCLGVPKGEGLLPVCGSGEAACGNWKGGPWRCCGWG
jgi:hypothetical protein